MKKLNIYTIEPIPGNAKITASNLTSRRSGEAVRNQFCIRTGTGHRTIFQSYKTVCLVWDTCEKVLTVYPEAFNYSVTTSKYSRYFLEDECGWTSDEVDELRKLEKAESYGRDCPLYIKK